MANTPADTPDEPASKQAEDPVADLLMQLRYDRADVARISAAAAAAIDIAIAEVLEATKAERRETD